MSSVTLAPADYPTTIWHVSRVHAAPAQPSMSCDEARAHAINYLLAGARAQVIKQTRHWIAAAIPDDVSAFDLIARFRAQGIEAASQQSLKTGAWYIRITR